VAAIHGLNEGTLRIGSFGASSSIYLLPEILETFRQRYPKIEIYMMKVKIKKLLMVIGTAHRSRFFDYAR
jgi:hypothetical protein